ncbi:MAG: hypothetical protein RIE24_11680 [Silicimonas sp.]
MRCCCPGSSRYRFGYGAGRYLGLIAAFSGLPGPLMARALAAGGSSLRIYPGQSIFLSTIFSGCGLRATG